MKKLILLLALLPFLASGQITQSSVNSRIDQRVSNQILPANLKNAMKYIAAYARQADSTALAANLNAVDLTSTQTISGNKTWTGTNAFGTATVSADFAPNVDNFVRLGTSTNRWTFVYASQFMGTGATLFGTTNSTSNILFRQGSTAQIVGGFLGSSNFILQAPSATLTTDTGHRFQNNGTTRLGGDVSVTGHIVPPTNTTYDLGSQTNGWRQVIGVGFLSPSGAQFGTYGSGSQIAFRQGTTSQLIGGAYPNTGNWTFQASAANLGTDTGERLQVEGTSKLNGSVNTGGHITPLTADTWNIGSSTSKYFSVFANNFYSSGSVRYGSVNTAGAILFNQNSSQTAYVGGFYGNTGNFFLQPNGGFVADNGYKLQVTGNGRFTGDLVQGSTGNYLNYNTTDEVTNFERGYAKWLGNVFTLGTEAGGTGANRTISIRTPNTQFNVRDAPSTSFFEFSRGTSSTNISLVATTGVMSQSSGSLSLYGSYPSINQSATAGYNIFYASPFEQTVGSGSKFLINVGTNSAANNGGTHTPKFTVDNNGAVSISGDVSPATNTTYNLGTSTLRWNNIYATHFVSSGTAYFGSTSGGQGFYFRQGSATNQLVGGFHPTTANQFIQAPGTIPTDTGERLQVAGTAKITADVSLPTASSGVILTSPNGTKYRLTVSDAGAAVFTLVP